MSGSDSFEEFIRRVRAGDEAAVREVVRRYEPILHHAAHARLVNAGLRPVLESADVSQSVFAAFFARAAAGAYEIETPEQLHRLLITMARNQLRSAIRKERARCRDRGRTCSGSQEEGLFVDDATPSRQLAARELWQQVQGHLSDGERELLQWRYEGHGWATIAGRLQGSPEGLRKRLARALGAIVRCLRLDELLAA
jgi:RNA polymerase sigma-70 factor (ECF subfamily)